jgi:hypothetical protein
MISKEYGTITYSYYGAKVYPEPHLAPMRSGIGVTPGEAGFYYADADGYYCYPDLSRLDCRQMFAL